jgi:ATP-dependent RNA helicase RhlE
MEIEELPEEAPATEAKPSFEDFKLNRQLLNGVADLGWDQPTPVQRKTIPLALGGSDVMGIAQTGTGKTAAYLLPLLMKIKYAQGTTPRAVVFAPTRELVMQIGEEARKLAAYTDLRILCLYGGLGPKPQIEALQQGIDILVATPGRFMDLYLSKELITKELKIMVLDEADKMMDMGFMPQIRRILEIVPRKRQNLLFSATMPDKVLRLSEEFLAFPVRVELSPQATTAQTVDQVLYRVPNFKTKINLLAHLLQDPNFSRVIIFARTKQNADNISKFIERKVEKSVRVIHANKGQNTRINAMSAFKEGGLRILVATDVAARGIDVSMVSHVVNFDVPIIYEDYVHRIGRTGRANQLGQAVTFCTKEEDYHVAKIEKIIRQGIPVADIPAGVDIEATPFDEEQQMLREIDQQRRREDPTFQGAFHEKKQRPTSNKNQKSTIRTKKK